MPGAVGPDEAPKEKGDCVEWFSILIAYVVFILSFPLAMLFCLRVVADYERAVIFRLGRLRSAREAEGPGVVFLLPCIDDCTIVDLRIVTIDVDPQEVLTKDSVTIGVDAIIYYRIFDPLKSVLNIAELKSSTALLAATILRNILSSRGLVELLSERTAVSNEIWEILDLATDPWGVKVERVEIMNIQLPPAMQRSMAAEAEASREARAKVISAEGELKASRALKAASDVMMETPAALQLRYLQTLHTISAEKSSTIIFPIPLDII